MDRRVLNGECTCDVSAYKMQFKKFLRLSSEVSMS
jgi:hypothetical protein